MLSTLISLVWQILRYIFTQTLTGEEGSFNGPQISLVEQLVTASWPTAHSHKIVMQEMLLRCINSYNYKTLLLTLHDKHIIFPYLFVYIKKRVVSKQLILAAITCFCNLL